MPTLEDFVNQAATAVPVDQAGQAAGTQHLMIDRMASLFGPGGYYQIGQNITAEAAKELMLRAAQSDGLTGADAEAAIGQSLGAAGKSSVAAAAGLPVYSKGANGPVSAPDAYRYDTKSPTQAPSAGGGAGYSSAYGGGAGGGGSAGRTVAVGGYSGFGDTRLQGSNGSTLNIGPGGTPGGAPFDPTKPLGLDPSKFSGAPVGGASMFRSGTFPSAGDPFAQIGPQSSAQDVALALAKKQYANQQAALGIYGGLYDAYGTDPTLMGARRLAGDLAANPYSLDDATKSRIAGRGIDAIGSRAGVLQQQAADRAAVMGGSRGGAAADDAYRIQTNAANQAGNLERNLDIEQATRRPGELAAALGAVGGFGQSDAAGRASIATGAADRVLGQTSITGDALLLGALNGNAVQPKVNVNLGSGYGSGVGGYLGSV